MSSRTDENNAGNGEDSARPDIRANLKRAARAVRHGAEEVAAQAGEAFDEVRETARDSYRDVRGGAAEMAEDLGEVGAQWIARNPWRAVASAAAVGALLTLLFRRR